MYKIITLPLEFNGSSLKAGVVNYITGTGILHYIVPFVPIALPTATGTYQSLDGLNTTSTSYQVIDNLGEIDDIGLLQLQTAYKTQNSLTGHKLIAIAVQVSNFN